MDVLIVGAGGHGKVVLDILRAGATYNPIGFIDADPALAGTSVGGLPVLGHLNALAKLKGKVSAAIVAIGDNRARPGYSQKLRERGFELINAIHPSAVASTMAKLGRNVVIAAGVVISTEAAIGDDVILNTSAIVDHECEIGPAVHICPGAAIAGRVRIGEGAFIGLGCRIIQCLTIGEHATIGAGAVVIRDIPPGATAVGVPARVIKTAQPLAAAG
jgi:UDP-perosamine 4-acetyltransferase